MNRSYLSSRLLTSIFVGFAATFGSTVLGQPKVPSDHLSWETATAEMRSSGIAMRRDGMKLHLQLDKELSRFEIPRFYAALRDIVWEDGDPSSIKLTPEQETWRIECQRESTQGKTMVLDFGSPPLLSSEVEPVSSQTDGSYYLPACMATTAGEKVRFEPQSYKNTVGYWVGKQDSATWTVNIEEPGKFNLSILQGCGKGQGGSMATMKFLPGKGINPRAISEMRFKALETGHFQNFQWRYLGEVELPKGVIKVQVAPK
ncbi:MAG: hypothetical protein AB8B50_17530, partial [Pirellulaceae bacterium]